MIKPTPFSSFLDPIAEASASAASAERLEVHTLRSDLPSPTPSFFDLPTEAPPPCTSLPPSKGLFSPSPLDYAYTAGIIDGEGCISMSHVPDRGYQLTVFVGNTDINLLNWVHGMFGGRPPKAGSKPRNPNQNQGYYWRLQGKACLPLLMGVLPILITKRRQAELAIEYIETCCFGMGVRPSPEAQLRRDEILLEIKDLNNRKVR